MQSLGAIAHYDCEPPASYLYEQAILKKAIKKITFRKNEFKDKKLIAKSLKNLLQQITDNNGIELIYRNKTAF